MNDDMRASAVRKLRALADRLAAGDDVGAVFYALDKDNTADVGVTLSEAEDAADSSLEDARDNASFKGWSAEDPTVIEVGIVIPLAVCRQTVKHVYVAGGSHSLGVDYGMVDPDAYTGPEDVVLPRDEVA